jgi:hypothetical protein
VSPNPRDPAWAPGTGVPRINAGGGTLPGRTQPRRFRSAAVRAALLRLALLATIGLAAIAGGVYLVRYVFFDRSGDLPAGLFAGLADISGALVLATIALAAITLGLWVAWSSRVEANAPTIGAGEGAIGPAGAILWWFVPVANLFVPFGLILGLGRRLSDDRRPARDGLVVIWWLTLLGSGAAVVATWIELLDAIGDAAVRAALLHAALAQLAWLVAAMLSLAVVRYIQRRENFRATGAPSWACSGSNVLAPVPSPGGVLAGIPGAVRVPSSATTGSPSVGAVKGVPPPSRGPADLRFGTRRRRSGGLGWAVVAFFIVGFIVLPRLLNASRGTGPPVASADVRPSLVAIATGSARPPVTPPPSLTPGPSVTSGPSGSPGSSGAAVPSASPATGSPTPGTAEPSATAVPPPPSPPDISSAPAYLLDHVSAGDGTCAASPSASVPAGALAAITCRPVAPAVAELQYAVFPTSDAATLSYDAAVRSSGVVPGSGACLAGLEGETSFLTRDQPAGRILCFIDHAGGGAVPHLVWVDDRLAIIGLARGTATTLVDLFDWWKSQSGPV